MVQAVLFAVLSLIAVAMSIPAVEVNRLTQISDGPAVDPSLGFQGEEYQVVVDLDALHETASQIKYALDDLFALLDEAAQNVSSVTPHAIQKRQTDLFRRKRPREDPPWRVRFGGDYFGRRNEISKSFNPRSEFPQYWDEGRTRNGNDIRKSFNPRSEFPQYWDEGRTRNGGFRF